MPSGYEDGAISLSCLQLNSESKRTADNRSVSAVLIQFLTVSSVILPLIRSIRIHRILVVVRTVEVDDDVEVVLAAVHLDGAVFGGGAREFGNLGSAGVTQLIRVLVQGVPIQPMRYSLGVILRNQLLHIRIRVLFHEVDAGSLIAARRYQQRKR